MKAIAHPRIRRAAPRSSSLGSPPTLGLRLRVRLHRRRLDRELADGCSCEASGDHALRARQLADSMTRHELARSLRRVADSGNRRRALFSSAVPLSRGVEPWREALVGLASRLEQPVAVNVCGVARARELLTDGAGPLYSSLSGMSIGEAVWWVADGLQLCPPHAWGCPVIMKLDPEHVTWTCGRCGTMATTGDPAVRPA
jgi:hypothetical protein